MRHLSGLFFLVPALLFAQGNPYAIWENQATSAYWLVSLDAGTGMKTDIAPVPGVTAFVGGSNTAFNTDSLVYHFVGLSGSVVHLYSLDAVTGNVLYNPVLSGNIAGLHYNCNDGSLVALQVTGNTYELVTVQPATGTTTVVAPVGGISAYAGESFSFDPHQQLFSLVVLIGGNYYLRSYSVATGVLVSDNPFPDHVTAHRYSCADSALYGLWETAGAYKLEKIDPASGTHSTIAVLPGVTPGYVAESACVNAAGNYVYRGFDALNAISLISIDLSTGIVLNTVNTTDNAAGFEEGICCYGLPSAAPDGKHPAAFSVTPSFFTDHVNVTSLLPVESLRLYSGLGCTVWEQRLTPAATAYPLLLPPLPSGLYFLKASFVDGRTETQKLVRQ